MRATVVAWAVVYAATAGFVAAATEVPLNFYTSSECQTASTITPSASGNVSECLVTPGMASLHFGFVGCAGGGQAKPYFFQDTACGTRLDTLDGPFSTGDDGDCYTVYHATVAAMMLSCAHEEDNGETPLEEPTATATIAVGPVATGAAPAATTTAASDASNGIVGGWNALSSSAHIGIIVGAVALVLILLGLGAWNQRRRPVASDSIPPYSQVLANVVHAARWHAASGIFDTDSANAHTRNPEGPLPHRVIEMAFRHGGEEVRRKIGAAGELYVRRLPPTTCR
jgi:hypothetical protein